MTTEELKPCPNCDSRDIERIGDGYQREQYECAHCEVSGPVGSTSYAFIGWQTMPRHGDDQALKREVYRAQKRRHHSLTRPSSLQASRALLERMKQAGWDKQPEQQETTGNDQ